MTAEQQARDMLERMGVEDAQSFSAGDLVELANLIEDRKAPQLERENADLRAYVKQLIEWELEGEALVKEKGIGVLFRMGAWWADRPWRGARKKTFTMKQIADAAEEVIQDYRASGDVELDTLVKRAIHDLCLRFDIYIEL